MQKKIAPGAATSKRLEIQQLIADQVTDRGAGDIAKTNAGEALRARKKERDHEREPYRARKSRARRAHDTDGRVIVPGETRPRWLDTPKTLDQLFTEDFVLPDAAHIERVHKLQLILKEAEMTFEPSAFRGELRETLAVHTGKVSRDIFERVRAMYAASGLELSSDAWKRRLRLALRNALRSLSVGGDSYVRKWNSQQIEQHGVTCGSSGVTIRKWLEVQGYVPPTLTAELIQGALQRSTLGRGGTRKRLVNWETALAELIRSAEPHSVR